MILVQEVLVSEEVLERRFHCKLSACKGACCWEGDWGAPLSDNEQSQLEAHLPSLLQYLTEQGRKEIDRQGTSVYYKSPDMIGTPLIGQGACAYLVKSDGGIARCSIEIAYEQGAIPFQKPISCHLYPIRVHEEPSVGLVALNYDEWDICQAACSHGSELDLLVVKFLEKAIIRRFGESFYEELLALAEDWNKVRSE
ncbi:MAG: DUF3109 family protein [Saprospiraceae bacterium]|nr:DUF3109 family protein [Saprospiraceae bacterium]